jgi:broad specificity phosphatase PhoE
MEQQTLHRVWLVRHGSTVWNEQQRFCGHSDIALASEGHEQIAWLRERLRHERIGAVYASDLVRTHVTAEDIVAGLARSVKVGTSPAWREIYFGAWEGLTYAEIATRFPDQLGFFTDPVQHAPPGGETLAQLDERVWSAFLHVLAHRVEEGESDSLIVSHGGPLRVLLCRVLGLPVTQQWRFTLAPGSLSAFDVLPGEGTSDPSGILVLLNALPSTLTGIPTW